MKNLNTVAFLVCIYLFSCENKSDSSSNDIIILNEQVVLLQKEGKYDQAKNVASKMVEKYPDSSLGWANLAAVYLALNQDSLAIKYAKRSLQIDSTRIRAHVTLAITLDKQRSYHEAYKHYKKVLDKDVDSWVVYSNFVGNRRGVGDYQSAVLYGEKAVSLGKNLGDMGILCSSYHMAGMYGKRDSLYSVLEERNYQYLAELKDLFSDTPPASPSGQ